MNEEILCGPLKEADIDEDTLIGEILNLIIRHGVPNRVWLVPNTHMLHGFTKGKLNCFKAQSAEYNRTL